MAREFRQGAGPGFCAVAAAVLGTLGLPAIATASTVHSPDSGITLTAPPGERNFLSVAPSGGMLRLHDDLADLIAGFACTQVDPRTVDCPPRGQPATFDLGDDRDELRVGTGTAIPIVARGGDGNDALIAFGAGPSNLDGGGGNDFLGGGDAADSLSGGPGSDQLRGDVSDANGTVSSDKGGDDLLSGGPDTDSYDGGAGLDTVSYADATSVITAVLPRPPEEGNTTIPGQGGEGEGLPPDVEGVIGGPLADNLTGNNAGNRLEGGPGRDTLKGNKGSDLLAGGDGGDAIFARDSIPDLISCGTNGPSRLARPDTLDSDLADGTPPSDCETVTQGALLEGANVRMRGGLLRADRDGSVAVRLRCPRSVVIGCVGRLVLRIQSGRGSSPRSQAAARSRRYRIRRGRSKAVSLRLSRRERATLRRGVRLARLTSIEAGKLGRKTTIRTVRLRRTR